jgi:hypothetical protein
MLFTGIILIYPLWSRLLGMVEGEGLRFLLLMSLGVLLVLSSLAAFQYTCY